MRLLPWMLIGMFATSLRGSELHAQDTTSAESPQQFFDRFVALEQAHDVSVADLYADDALIQTVRRLPNGTARTLRYIGADYKRMIASAMPLAQKRGDRNRYSDVTVSIENERPHIRCTRYNELTHSSTPYELVLERADDHWHIIEEYFRSHP